MYVKFISSWPIGHLVFTMLTGNGLQKNSYIINYSWINFPEIFDYTRLFTVLLYSAIVSLLCFKSSFSKTDLKIVFHLSLFCLSVMTSLVICVYKLLYVSLFCILGVLFNPGCISSYSLCCFYGSS